ASTRSNSIKWSATASASAACAGRRRRPPSRSRRTHSGACATPFACAPPNAATNEPGGFRTSFTVALTGLDIDEKAALAEATFWDACPYGPDDFDSIVSRVVRTDKSDPDTHEEADAISCRTA